MFIDAPIYSNPTMPLTSGVPWYMVPFVAPQWNYSSLTQWKSSNNDHGSMEEPVDKLHREKRVEF